MPEKLERDFKGVWIPKEIWLTEELSIMEKLFLVEINSLDNENGCFASNPYFAKFFGLKNTRVSQIINSLIKKGYISANYERKGREIVKRVLIINCKKVFNKLYEGIQKSVTRYSENCKDNNTGSNTINNPFNNMGKPQKTRFIPPSLPEIKQYLKDNKIDNVDPEKFWHFYESKGWMIGKNKMKNWHSAIATWAKNDFNSKDKSDTKDILKQVLGE